MTGLEPTRLMRHRHLKLALSVCGTSSASTKSKISCCGTSSASTKSKISCCGTSSASTKSKIWCNSATAVLKCISNKKQAVFLRLVLVRMFIRDLINIPEAYNHIQFQTHIFKKSSFAVQCTCKGGFCYENKRCRAQSNS